MTARLLGASAPAVLASLFVVTPALADAAPKPNSGIWASVGVPLGLGIHRGPNQFFFGAEASVFHLNRDFRWLGGYADIVAEPSSEAVRVSVGPEIGMAILGIDAGYVKELGGAERHGFAVRPMLTLAFTTFAFRVGHFPGDDGGTYGELTLLVKVPFEIKTEPHRIPRPATRAVEDAAY